MTTIKNIIRRRAQQILGFSRYLFWFSRFTIFRIRVLKSEKAFRFFMSLVPGDGAILDIGANIGINTVMLAKAFPRAVIHAFEPVEENYQTLEKIIASYRLKNVQLYQTALGEKAGEAAMIMPHHEGSKMQGWSRMHEGEDQQLGMGERFIVGVQRLDDVGALKNANIGAIKIDVENFEYFVLKGGELLLKKNKPLIFCELWNDERRMLCFDFLRGLGYRVMIFRGNKLVPHAGEDALNYFFIPGW